MAGANLDGVADLEVTLEEISDRWSETVVYSVGTNVEYAIYVEYGTHDQQAQPYLRVAAERTRRQLPALAEEADSIEDLVESAAQLVERIAKQVVPVDTGRLRASIEAVEIDESGLGDEPGWA